MRDSSGFVAAGVLSLAYQALVVGEMTILARALNVHVTAAVFGAVLTLVLVATMIPSRSADSVSAKGLSLSFSRVAASIRRTPR
jgi:hypothetical protein